MTNQTGFFVVTTTWSNYYLLENPFQSTDQYKTKVIYNKLQTDIMIKQELICSIVCNSLKFQF